MATENSDNPPAPPLPTPSLPQYPEMIMVAIEALNDNNRFNKSAMATYIESMYGHLPSAHATLLAHYLNKMKQSGEPVLVKNNYTKPDPNAPPKRGRGRLPKPKVLLPPGTVVSHPRPSGRPPKPRNPFAPQPEPESPFRIGRPGGRPPKKAKMASAPPQAPASAPATTIGAPRGKGGPPKVKPVMAPVGC